MPRKPKEEPAQSEVLSVLAESVHIHAARLRNDLARLSDHAKELANYVANLHRNADLLLSESTSLRVQAEDLLRKSRSEPPLSPHEQYTRKVARLGSYGVSGENLKSSLASASEIADEFSKNQGGHS